jgi:cyanate lyase
VVAEDVGWLSPTDRHVIKAPDERVPANLTNIVEKRGISVADLAERTGYNPLFFENIVMGKNRQMPVDFFLRVARVLDLSEEEKDALVRSWAFGRA